MWHAHRTAATGLSRRVARPPTMWANSSASASRAPPAMLRLTGGCCLSGFEALLLERSPDFLVVLDGEHKVVRASAGLRSSVPLVSEGADFARSLDEASQARLLQGLSIDRD